VTCTSDRQWDAVAAHIGAPEVSRSQGARVLADWAATRPARVVEAELLTCGMPAGRVRHPLEACDDPNVRVLEELRHPTAQRGSGFLGPRLPVVFGGRVDVAPAELLGSSTDVVLRELAEAREDDLARLRADGVIA
jgi:crotonobetainyl-CoA:carnitine CoA-transferase CaiB-like acyl-CoA transferase